MVLKCTTKLGMGEKHPFPPFQFFIVPEKIASISSSDGFRTRLCGFKNQTCIATSRIFSFGDCFSTSHYARSVGLFLPIPLAGGSTSFVSVSLR